MIFYLAELQKPNPLLHSILKLKWRNSILETGMEISGRSQRTQGAPPQHQYCRGGHADDPLFVKYIYVARAGIWLGVEGSLQTWGLITAHYRLITNVPVPTHCFSFVRKIVRLRKKGRGGALNTSAFSRIQENKTQFWLQVQFNTFISLVV